MNFKEACDIAYAGYGGRNVKLKNICGEGAREITADVELPGVILRQGEQTLIIHSEEQLCELMELIEECFTHFDDARQPKARKSEGAA